MKEDNGEALAVLSWETNSLPKQTIPSTAFRSFSNPVTATGRNSALTSYDVAGPGGRGGTAQPRSLDRGPVLGVRGDISSVL